MKLSFIVTIDPVKDISLLNILIHSLNLQTQKAFNVIFYNQTLLTEKEIFSRLTVQPDFEYQFFCIERNYFLGRYPIWDLFTFHNFLLDNDYLNDYFMSLHMEELLDVNYLENVIPVLEENGIDILFGNLSRTRSSYQDLQPILHTESASQFDQYLSSNGIKKSYHWAFDYFPMFYLKNVKVDTLKLNLIKLITYQFRRSLKPNKKGFTKLRRRFEDVHFMRKDFALKYDWFFRGQNMYFTDIHITYKKKACNLETEIKGITEFPIFFNLSKIYHLEHEKFYYHIQDDQFVELFLRYETTDPILNTHKTAIKMVREGKWDLRSALRYTRENDQLTGTHNMEYKYRKRILNKIRKA